MVKWQSLATHRLAQMAAAAASSGARRGRASKGGLRGARRRLSVVSDNKLVEGLQPIGTVADESVQSKEIDHVVRTYAGVSKKGYAPYNPRKRNQDAIMMVEDAKTMTLLFGVLDGHGEAGDLVSHYITARLPDRTFANPKWETDPVAAIAAETARLEKSVLSGEPEGRRMRQAVALFPEALEPALAGRAPEPAPPAASRARAVPSVDALGASPAFPPGARPGNFAQAGLRQRQVWRGSSCRSYWAAGAARLRSRRPGAPRWPARARAASLAAPGPKPMRGRSVGPRPRQRRGQSRP